MTLENCDRFLDHQSHHLSPWPRRVVSQAEMSTSRMVSPDGGFRRLLRKSSGLFKEVTVAKTWVRIPRNTKMVPLKRPRVTKVGSNVAEQKNAPKALTSVPKILSSPHNRMLLIYWFAMTWQWCKNEITAAGWPQNFTLITDRPDWLQTNWRNKCF